MPKKIKKDLDQEAKTRLGVLIAEARSLKSREAITELRLAKVLHELYTDDRFPNWREYLATIGETYSRAMKLMRAHRAIEFASLDTKMSKAIGVTKLALLDKRLTAKNTNDLIGLAVRYSVAQLRRHLRTGNHTPTIERRFIIPAAMEKVLDELLLSSGAELQGNGMRYRDEAFVNVLQKARLWDKNKPKPLKQAA